MTVALGMGCSSGPTEVILPPLEAVAASGDSQYGTVNQVLQTPLQVVVRDVSSQLPRSGMTIEWSVEQGAASFETISTTVTDSTGSASVRVRLGAQTGDVVVRAQVPEQDRATATFRLFTVDRPVLSSLAPTSADPGQTITLSGSDFSPTAEQNVVLFSGIRGNVTVATSTELTVEVPGCLPERGVSVTVQLGTIASGSQPLDVGPGGEVRSLQVGDVVDANDPGGLTCVTVPGDGSARYVAIAQSVSSIGAAAHPFQITGLGATGTPLQAAVHRAETRPAPVAGEGAENEDIQVVWDRRLRELEAHFTTDRVPRPPGSGPESVEGPAEVPQLNERRTFQVFRNPGDFVEVTAVARHVGERAALFVDVDAPSGGYTGADLQLFSERFDRAIYPVVTESFGAASDLDDNQRIVILFTPAVNALTPRGASGFIAGFFFGLDLLPEQNGSNAGEIFYALVPDPTGQLSDPRPKAGLLDLTPAILAHEFQHMVNFNERVLVRGAEANEAVWLSEALAQYAEELVASRYDSQGDAVTGELFRVGARDRSRRYLAAPESISLVVAAGQGSLEERGGGFLYMLYVAERFGVDLVGRLTRTTRTGVANVEAETGGSWADMLSDWWSAIYLDGPGPESGSLTYGDLDLRGFLEDPFPLKPAEPGVGDFVRSGLLPSSAAAYYIVTPPAAGSMTFRLGGAAGGVSGPQAGLRMRIIRVQ